MKSTNDTTINHSVRLVYYKLVPIQELVQLFLQSNSAFTPEDGITGLK